MPIYIEEVNMTIEMKYNIGDRVWLISAGSLIIEDRVRSCRYEKYVVSRKQSTEEKRVYSLMVLGGVHDEATLYATEEELTNSFKTKT